MLQSLRVIVKGRVQGVGFRAFTVGQAKGLGLSGWVRNRRDGTVEAVIAGPAERVERMLMALRVGPPSADVTGVHTTPSDEPLGPGFEARPTA